MRALARLGAFGLGLAVVFGTAAAVGAAVGDGPEPPAPEQSHGNEHGASPSRPQLPGLTSSTDGFTLGQVALREGRLSFVIADSTARPSPPTHPRTPRSCTWSWCAAT